MVTEGFPQGLDSLFRLLLFDHRLVDGNTQFLQHEVGYVVLLIAVKQHIATADHLRIDDVRIAVLKRNFLDRFSDFFKHGADQVGLLFLHRRLCVLLKFLKILLQVGELRLFVLSNRFQCGGRQRLIRLVLFLQLAAFYLQLIL